MKKLLDREMKKCTKCGEERHLSKFYKKNKNSDDLFSRCKVCVNAVQSIYRSKNRESIKAYSAKYRIENSASVNAAQAKWYAEHSDKVAARRAKVYAENIESSREKSIKYYYENKDHVLERIAKWKKANPEKSRVYSQNRRNITVGRLSPDLAIHLFVEQDGVCLGCREDLGNDFHMDHIIPLSLGGLNADENIQLLCPTCNMSKGSKHPDEWNALRGSKNEIA